MLKDQNRIELQVRNGIYEEFTLMADDAASLLPGAMVAMQPMSVVNLDGTGYNSDAPTVSSQATDLDGFETLIVIENALLGKGIHAKQYPGEVILARRAVDADCYLLRAVAGSYRTGQALYATQTANGIYVSPVGTGKFIGWCQEFYEITPEMVDVIDDSTRETPSTVNVNGLMANLVKVRIGNIQKTGSGGHSPPPVTPPIDFTAVADGDATTSSTKITITFASAPEADLATAEVAVTPNSVATKGTLTKITATIYELALIPVSTGTASVQITKTGVVTTAKTVNVTKYVAPPITFTAVADGDATTTSTKITLTFASAPSADVVATDVALTPVTVATKGTLTKISSTVYELSITPVATGTATVTITKTGVSGSGVTANVNKYVAPEPPAPPAPVGYWGVCYPDARASNPSATPTAEEIMALTGKTEITGEKRNIAVTFVMNDGDWQRVAGDEADYFDAEGGRGFFITKEDADWGDVLEITQNGADVSNTFGPFSIVIDGTTYSGYIELGPVFYPASNTPTTFKFV